IERRTAYQYIDAAAVVENVRHGAQTEPANERQARPLTRLEPDDQPAAWAEAVETAPEGKVTAAHVEAVVAKWKKPQPEAVVHDEPLSGVVDSRDGLVAAGTKFGTIYADPPWRYGNTATRANVEGHYAGTMTVDEICAMPV